MCFSHELKTLKYFHKDLFSTSKEMQKKENNSAELLISPSHLRSSNTQILSFSPTRILMSLNKFDVRSCPNGWLKWSSLFWEWQRNVLPRLFHKAHLSTHPRICLSAELYLLHFISCFCFSNCTGSIPVKLRFG